jgi:alkylhydroperoxidase/carboxymuconolactone decarboxylase family protein YurZ
MTCEAWVTILSEEAVRATLPPGAKYPYDFGFLPAMGRLIRTHPRIAQAWVKLFGEIMWSPESVLSRQEREMIAGVAAAAQDCHY